MLETSAKMSATLSALPDNAWLEPIWRGLEERADASFFQSWYWIGTWLDCLPSDIAPELLRVDREGVVVGLAVIVPRTVYRHRFLRSKGLFLNRTGNPGLDSLTIEYNGFLSERGAERDVARVCTDFLLSEYKNWDELFLDGMSKPELFNELSLGQAQLHTGKSDHGHYVDLAALRASGQEYVATLGQSTRYNIRRSLREYEKRGALAIDEAGDLTRASTYLKRLGHLHQCYWEKKGKPGAFANRFFLTFHEKLVERGFSDGAVQLLRVTAGGAEVGYLYNYVYRGHVYNYQGGFDYSGGRLHERPGLVCHALAIEHNMQKGHSIYDFMAGDSAYKRNLSTASETLAWQVVQRRRLKFRIEDGLRRLRRWLKMSLVNLTQNENGGQEVFH